MNESLSYLGQLTGEELSPIVEDIPPLERVTVRCREIDMSQFPPSKPSFTQEQIHSLSKEDLAAAVCNAVCAEPVGLDAVGRSLLHQLRVTLQMNAEGWTL